MELQVLNILNSVTLLQVFTYITEVYMKLKTWLQVKAGLSLYLLI